MELDKEWEWENGTICDPKSVYDCEMWFEDGDFDTLKVRYILFLFRTQEWYRMKD